MKQRIVLAAIVLFALVAVPVGAAVPPIQEGGQEYVVQDGDSLSAIAHTYYDDMVAYPTIVEATNAKAKEDSSFATITNADLIEVGQKLWIPTEVTAVVRKEGTLMAKTFSQMVAEAMAEVPVISAEEANRRMQEDPRTLVIDARDAEEIPLTGIIPGAMNISYGALTYKADNEVPPEWREPELQDRSRPIITTCESGELGALAGKLLKDMGFTDVSILEGGTLAWKDAGFPTQ